MRYKLMCAVMAALLGTFVLQGQETRGTIYGTVSDPQGAAVAGAVVTVANTATNVENTVKTNATGYYAASLLNAGQYRISVAAPGFKKTVRSGIDLLLGAHIEIDVALRVGVFTQTVAVTGQAPLVETSSNVSAGMIMQNRQVNNLPVFNNSPLMLIKLAPGIEASSNRRYNGVNALGGTSEAHNLGNVGGNQWSIDGVPDMGSGYAAAYLPYSTTIQDYKVETQNFDASVGHTSGAVI
ncbi:MAG: carboxypeptidase-like regulatory domain-containing protein, partial [Candidatus Acidiferrales bacterium]